MTIFYEHLRKNDPDILELILKEEDRQRAKIELIASENYVSKAVLEAQGSILTNKYAEGYPGRRYYGGCHIVDLVEELAIQRAQKLFDVNFANVQPHSGSQANQAVYAALLSPGDRILGMSLDCGGHLTHGAKVSQSGKLYEAYSYGVDPQTMLLNYDDILVVAKTVRPKLIIAGGSAYPRFIEFAKFREIADEVGAYLMVDMAHFAGQVAVGLYENPVKYAHAVTTTTHKTLRGPRGGMILTDYEDLSKKINAAVFPGVQGGPLMHVIAAKAVAFNEAMHPSFRNYISNVLKNINAIADIIAQNGIDICTNGTDSHLILVDLKKVNITGLDTEKALESAGIVCNKNAIPFDPRSPKLTSGIRLGSPAITTRGFGVEECKAIGAMISDIVHEIAAKGMLSDALRGETFAKVKSICSMHPNVFAPSLHDVSNEL